LVSARRDGQWVYYSLNEDALEAAEEFVEQLQRSSRSPHLADDCSDRA
jgi:DNA-binding transcriptional ArsR family regulator